MSVLSTHNVHVYGDPDAQPMLFAHGFGCEQGMWRFVAPAFEATHRVVLFDHMGLGSSDLAHYDAARYSDLGGYADDILEICEQLDLRDVVFVGHSVSAMIGILAAGRNAERFASLVLIGPSPRYIDEPASGYVGGFAEADIDDLLATLQSNYLGWSASMAPAIMNTPGHPELGDELTESFCRADPDIAHRFAKATFLADNRADLPGVAVPSLVLQCRSDMIAPEVVGRYVAEALPKGEFRLLDATGHCPNLSAPVETIAAIRDFLA